MKASIIFRDNGPELKTIAWGHNRGEGNQKVKDCDQICIRDSHGKPDLSEQCCT